MVQDPQVDEGDWRGGQRDGQRMEVTRDSRLPQGSMGWAGGLSQQRRWVGEGKLTCCRFDEGGWNDGGGMEVQWG